MDGFGYEGFGFDEIVQMFEEFLIKVVDVVYLDGVVRVGFEFGSQYRYFGVGYIILQLFIEELIGKFF